MSSQGIEARALSGGERVAVTVVMVLVGLLGVLGFVNSFARVADAVAPSFGRLAWTVPLGIDVGIAVFTGLDLVLARLGMRTAWLRLFPWALVAVTIFLNVAEESTPVGVVAHGVLPGLWVIAVEAGSHAMRARAGLNGGRGRAGMDRVRRSRWLLAPLATVKLWRRMVLWEVTDYPTALRRERARVLARCELVDRYGRLVWRWKSPRRQRVLYRLGELAPTGALAEATSEPRADGKRSTSGARRPSARPAPVTSVDELVPLGRRVAAELTRQGRPLSRRELVAGMRQAGQPIGSARAAQLLTLLRTDQSFGHAAPQPNTNADVDTVTDTDTDTDTTADGEAPADVGVGAEVELIAAPAAQAAAVMVGVAP